MQLPRFELTLKVLYGIKVGTLLDLGCSNGSLTMEIANIVQAREIYGVDIDESALREAAMRGIKTFYCDLSKDSIPLPSESIDLVTALEVIEHLFNPDHILREVYRVLRKDGYFLITTPNLASWINRIAMLFGYQPYNAEVSTEILAGVPWKAYSFTKPSGHIRPFTLRALKELLHHHGFKIIKIKGAHGVNPPYRLFRLLDLLFTKKPSLARRLIVLAQKP